MKETPPAVIADAAPVAAKKPYQVVSPHGSREDEYYWLRDDKRENPEMLAYVKAENAYADAMLAHIKPLETKVYNEIIGRLQQDDSTVPYLMNGYWYFRRYETGKEYPIYSRRAGTLDAPEEILLNGNELAKGHDFFEIGDIAISPEQQAHGLGGRHRRPAAVRREGHGPRHAQDLPHRRCPTWKTTSSGRATTRRSSTSRKIRRRCSDSACAAIAWTARTTPTSPRIRWSGPRKTRASTRSSYRTKDEKFLLIHTQSTVSTEVLYADAASKKLEFKVFLPRERDHEYQVEHANGRWIVRTNFQAKNFRIVEVPKGAEADRAQMERRRGASRRRLRRRVRGVRATSSPSKSIPAACASCASGRGTAAADVFVTADEPSYTMALDVNREFDSDKLRYTYQSMVTPKTTYDYDFKTAKREMLKREPVLGGYDPANYANEFAWATARDGVKVPVSIVYRKTTPRDGTAPLLQIGYGSYGSTYDPEFSYLPPSLLDRGFVVAIAHIRGGQEMGRAWYENGKLLNKKNSFTDFIDVTRWLAANKYSDPKRAFALGRSAGGLLMGAIANMAPQDYRGIVTGVPFVDVVTTMLDETIPLTTNEFDEWGNPKKKEFYDYMLSYSPYDQLGAHDYPAMFVHSGLWDSQVQYFEPTKYVARLRARRTGDSLVVLRTNMEAGHGGKSGRYEHFREYAEQYAFIIDQAGIKE